MAQPGDVVTYAYFYANVMDPPKLIGIGDNVQEIFGYSREEWEAEPLMWDRLVHPEDLKRVTATTWQVSTATDSYYMVYRMVTRAGDIVWIEDAAEVNRHHTDGSEVWYGSWTVIDDPTAAPGPG
jgi:PAS domain S-box-containing protein